MANFYTDVISADPRFDSVTRVNDINLLEPITRQAVADVIADASVMGIDLMVFETYRSQARQQVTPPTKFFTKGENHVEENP